MKLGVLGGGAWGTALAQVAAQGGRETLLWALEEDVVAAVNRIHENPIYLQGLKLDPAIRGTGNFSELAECDAWIVATPAQHMRAVLERMPCPKMPLVLCSKGIEESSGALLHEVAHVVRAARDICDVDQDPPVVQLAQVALDVEHVDPGLPALERLVYGVGETVERIALPHQQHRVG